MLSKQRIFIIVSTGVILFGLILFTSGCGGDSGSASNPAAPTGSGNIQGTIYQERNVQLSSTNLIERIRVAFVNKAESLVSISDAYASVKINLSNSSPSSGILVELLLNGTVVAKTTTGPNGKFEFTGLGSGDYTLRFTKGTDLLITTNVNVKEGAMTEVEGKITLASSGNVHLSMEIEKRRQVDHYFEHENKESGWKRNGDTSKIEIKGIVTSISPLTVNASGILYTVNTNSNTKFEGTLKIGSTVEVEGTLIGTNTILAKEVEVEEPKSSNKVEIEIEGTVMSTSPLTVNAEGTSYTISTDSKTRLKGILAVGMSVEVEGTLIGTNTILAKKIEIEESENSKKD